MANTLRGLSADLRTFAASLPDQASEIAKGAALAIMKELVNVTPVDTGTAMSNWQVYLDQSPTDTVEAWEPSRRGYWASRPQPRPLGTRTNWTHRVDPQTTFQNNVGPQYDIYSAALRYKTPGQAITITNNLPYIQVLDNGSSEQTPAGFVDRALLLGENIVVSARIKVTI